MSDLDTVLQETLDDQRLSRTEKKALRSWLEDQDLDLDGRRAAAKQAIERAALEVTDPASREIMEWLHDVLGLILRAPGKDERGAGETHAEALFSPGEVCRAKIKTLLGRSKTAVDICVFTITDNEVSRAIMDAHRRGVRVRVITDDDKSEDRGSDIEDLIRAGVDVRFDSSPYHMHHKFAMFDRAVLLTGSYNWTRGAAVNNEENIVVTDDPRLVKAFTGEFEKLWTKFS